MTGWERARQRERDELLNRLVNDTAAALLVFGVDRATAAQGAVTAWEQIHAPHTLGDCECLNGGRFHDRPTQHPRRCRDRV